MNYSDNSKACKARVRASRESARLRVGGYRTRQKKERRKDKTNIAQKEKRDKERPNPEREVEKKTARPGWRFFGAKYLFEDSIY